MKSGIWRNPFAFSNNFSIHLVTLVIQLGAKKTKINEFLNHLVTEKAALL
jgi:hypothetical protein